jgi:hypothetical protein
MPCGTCGGARLKTESLLWRMGTKGGRRCRAAAGIALSARGRGVVAQGAGSAAAQVRGQASSEFGVLPLPPKSKASWRCYHRRFRRQNGKLQFIIKERRLLRQSLLHHEAHLEKLSSTCSDEDPRVDHEEAFRTSKA